MANTFTLTYDGQVIDSGQNVLDTISRKVTTITQADDEIWRETVTVGTSEANLTIPLTSVGYVLAYLRDATNFVQLGMDDSGTMKVLVRLTPDLPFALFPVDAGATIRHKADTAACVVDFRAWSK